MWLQVFVVVLWRTQEVNKMYLQLAIFNNTYNALAVYIWQVLTLRVTLIKNTLHANDILTHQQIATKFICEVY